MTIKITHTCHTCFGFQIDSLFL